MGLPNLVLGGTIASLLYKSLGYSDTQIAFWTGLIVLPWSFNYLLANKRVMLAGRELFIMWPSFSPMGVWFF